MLLHRIEIHLRRTGVPPTRFSREATGDPRFVHDLRRGRTVGDRLRQRVQRYLEQAR